jgi:hypothetical protein
MEVPVFFPTLEDESKARYRIHLDDPDDKAGRTSSCSLTRSDPMDLDHDRGSTSSKHHHQYAAAEASAPPYASNPGAATVTRLGSTNGVVATVLRDGEPSVLSVSVRGGGPPGPSSAAAFELDVSPCYPRYHATAKVQAFCREDYDGNGTCTVRLLLVDREGMVLKVVCRWDAAVATFEPKSASFHNWRLRAPAVVPEHVTPHPLNRSRVGFLSPGRVLLALNPFLLVLDLGDDDNDNDDDSHDRVAIWSKDETRLEMERRANWSRRLSIFARAGPEPGTAVDMAAVSALSVAPACGGGGSNGDGEAVVVVVCTLHCDGAVHVWTVREGSGGLAPASVAEAAPRSLAPPSEWSNEDRDDRCVPLLTSRLYPQGRLFACAVYVPTATTPAGEHSHGGCLSVLHGRIDEVANPSRGKASSSSSSVGAIVEEVSLGVAEGAAALISMEFDAKNPNKCSLLAWFHKRQQQDHGGGARRPSRDMVTGTVCVTYPPSHTSILCKTPVIVAGWDGMLDQRAWKEKRRLESFRPLRSIYASDTLEQAVYAMDRQAMQLLFRPMSSSVTPPRGPSGKSVRGAIRTVALRAKLGPAAVQDLGAEPVEVEVVSFMHRWRDRESRRRGSAWQSSRGPSTDPSKAPTDTMDVEASHEMMEEIAKEVDWHASRWKELLLAVWSQEQSLRVPLLVSSFTGKPADAAITVRSGAISVIVSSSLAPQLWPPEQGGILDALDRASRDVVSFLANDKDLFMQLYEAESGILELVTSGDLAIHPGVSDPRFLMFDVIARKLQHPASPLAQYSQAISSLLTNVSEDDLIAELEDISWATPSAALIQPPPSTKNERKCQFFAPQSRFATSAMVSRKLESIHEQVLGRALVLSALCAPRRRLVGASRRMYLNTIALRWVLAQMVTTQVPKVRALDAILHRGFDHAELELIDPPSQSSLLDAASDEVVKGCFPYAATSSGESTIVLPELRLIDGLSAEYSRFHLVLLSPNLAIRPTKEAPVVYEKRKMVVALSLISCCTSETESRAREMVTRAFDLLSVDSDSAGGRPIRIDEMERHILKVKHPLVGSMFLSFLQNVIASMEHVEAATEEVDSLWSSSFYMAVSRQNWERAFQACVRMSNALKRTSHLKALSVMMVTSGAVEDLQSLCKSEMNRLAIAEAFPRSMMHEIAVDALEATDFEDHRYKQALFVLHAARGDWESGAEALDAAYGKTVEKLRREASSKSQNDALARGNRQRIVADLLSLALGCRCAIGSAPEGEKFLVTRHRASQQGGEGQAHELDEAFHQYFSLNDLALRAALVSSLLTLLSSGADLRFVDSVLLGDDCLSRDNVQDVCQALLSCGYFAQGLSLASVFSSNEFVDGDYVHVFLVEMLCYHLVPLALGDVSASSPSPEQLADALDALTSRQPRNLPPLLATCRSKKVIHWRSHCISTYAMALLQAMTTEYSTASMPLALEVAKSFLNRGYRVPAWLDSLLLWGADAATLKTPTPGLFSRRRGDGPCIDNAEGNRYLGDPAALLHYYTDYGRYVDASRVVTSLLNSQNRSELSAAPNRLPEKGNADFVPYNAIDRLWMLMDAAARIDSAKDPNRAKMLREAQRSVKSALENHFRLLKVSEDGLLSARAIPMQE